MSAQVGGTSGTIPQTDIAGNSGVQAGGASGVSAQAGSTHSAIAQAGSAGGGNNSCDGEALRAAVEGCSLHGVLGMCFISSDSTTSDEWGQPNGTIPIDGAGRPVSRGCIADGLEAGWACPSWAGVTIMYWCELYL